MAQHMVRVFAAVCWIQSLAWGIADPECKDEVPYCEKITEYCHDNFSIYHTFTRSNCKKSCRICLIDIDPSGLCWKEGDNGGCEQICEAQNRERKVCSCYVGYRLESDGMSCADDAVCGMTNMTGIARRSFRRVAPGDWPWQVLIRADDKFCGGVVLEDKWVLTTASCFGRSKSINWEMYFGIAHTESIDRNDWPLQKTGMRRTIIHPNWNATRPERNDIALIELDRALNITQFVKPVCLPNGERLNVGDQCFAVGWHRNKKNTPVLLGESELLTAHHDKCGSQLNSTTICALAENRSTGRCMGDVGGPMVCQRCDSCGWFVAGVLSTKSTCTPNDYHDVFTDVGYFEEWISRETSIEVTKRKPCSAE